MTWSTHIFWRAKLHIPIRIHFCTCDQSCIYIGQHTTYSTKSSYTQRWNFWGYGRREEKAFPILRKWTKARLCTRDGNENDHFWKELLDMMIFSSQANLNLLLITKRPSHEILEQKLSILKVFSAGVEISLRRPSSASFPPFHPIFWLLFFFSIFFSAYCTLYFEISSKVKENY